MAYERVFPPTTKSTTKSIGGWLILVGIFMVLGPLFNLFHLYTIFSDIGTVTSYPFFHFAFYKFTYVLSILLDVALFVAVINCTRLFFQKKKSFPGFFNFTMIANIIIDIAIPFLYFIAIHFNYDARASLGEFYNPIVIVTILRAVMYAAIWVPYMKFSERVKNTFTL
jgi:Protein of unknown function (DUF2569).